MLSLASSLAENLVLRIAITFRVDEDIVIPPFSPKVSMTIIHSLSNVYSRLHNKSMSFKPIAISPVFNSSIALLKYDEYRKPLILYSDKEYSFNATMIVDENYKPDDIIRYEDKVRLFNTYAIINSIGLRVKRFDDIGFSMDEGYIKIRVISPLLIQLPRYGRFRGNRHLLFPIPSIMVRSLVDHWNTYAPIGLRVKSPIYASLYSNYMLIEVDHFIKPVTVIYDSKRKARGFVGWVMYKVVKKRSKYHKMILRLLDYSNYVGIGRARASGFGMVNTYILSDNHA